jgi:hypothetical protein
MVNFEAEDGKKIHEEHAQQQKWRKRFNLKRGSTKAQSVTVDPERKLPGC